MQDLKKKTVQNQKNLRILTLSLMFSVAEAAALDEVEDDGRLAGAGVAGHQDAAVGRQAAAQLLTHLPEAVIAEA